MRSGAPTFEEDVSALFRDEDVEAMAAFFDLRSYDDVCEHAERIWDRVEDGSMPCDAMWTEEQLGVLRAWIDAGMPR